MQIFFLVKLLLNFQVQFPSNRDGQEIAFFLFLSKIRNIHYTILLPIYNPQHLFNVSIMAIGIRPLLRIVPTNRFNCPCRPVMIKLDRHHTNSLIYTTQNKPSRKINQYQNNSGGLIAKKQSLPDNFQVEDFLSWCEKGKLEYSFTQN